MEFITQQIEANQVILENVICRGEGENMIKAIIEPDMLSTVVQQTGCGFLLDTAHAQMTSMCLDLDVYDYISKLPMHQLKELHITGVQVDHSGRLRDSMPMTDQDWELAAWVIQQMKHGVFPEPWVTPFEYGGVGPKFEWRSQEEVLAKQIPLLYDLLNE